MIRNLLIASTLAAAVAAPASAATISVLPYNDQNQYQSPDNLIVDNLRGGFSKVNTNQLDVRDNRANAQAFVIPVATTIDKIVINYSDLLTDSSATDTTFQFFRVADPAASTLSVQDNIILDTVVFNGRDPAFEGMTTNGTLIFDVVDTVAAPGDAFAIRFNTASGTSRSIKWEFLESSVGTGYTGPRAYRGGTSQSYIYTIGVVEVPEPAALSLLGLGGLGLLRRRRQ